MVHDATHSVVKFVAVTERFDRMDARLETVSGRVTAVEREMTGLRKDMDHLTGTMRPIADELLREGVTSRGRAGDWRPAAVN